MCIAAAAAVDDHSMLPRLPFHLEFWDDSLGVDPWCYVLQRVNILVEYPSEYPSILISYPSILVNILISHEIIFEIFQLLWLRYINVTDDRTDRRTDDLPWQYCALCSIARQKTILQLQAQHKKWPGHGRTGRSGRPWPDWPVCRLWLRLLVFSQCSARNIRPLCMSCGKFCASNATASCLPVTDDTCLSLKRHTPIPFPSHCIHFPPQLLAFPRSVGQQADTGIICRGTSFAATTYARYSVSENYLCMTKN